MQQKPEYENVSEWETIASQLISKYPEVFGGIECDKIRCVAITNKERKEGKKMWEVRGVPAPISMDCPYSYYIVIYMSDWVELSEKRRSLLVASALMAIPNKEEKTEGKTNPFDMKDYATMVRTFGVDYLEDENAPDLLKDNVEWKF